VSDCDHNFVHYSPIVGDSRDFICGDCLTRFDDIDNLNPPTPDELFHRALHCFLDGKLIIEDLVKAVPDDKNPRPVILTAMDKILEREEETIEHYTVGNPIPQIIPILGEHIRKSNPFEVNAFFKNHAQNLLGSKHGGLSVEGIFSDIDTWSVETDYNLLSPGEPYIAHLTLYYNDKTKQLIEFTWGVWP